MTVILLLARNSCTEHSKNGGWGGHEFHANLLHVHIVFESALN